MFTGIVEKVARVAAVENGQGFSRIRVRTQFQGLELGESVAVNGACLTVAELPQGEQGTEAGEEAVFFVSSETLARTNLGRLKLEQRVNLERALPAHGRLSGHIVQGHVDGQGILVSVQNQGESYEVVFGIPEPLGRYCVEKGSICINGVSLTINSIREMAGRPALLGFTLIPHTWAHTNLSDLKPEEPVNVEADILAKHMERLCQPYLKR